MRQKIPQKLLDKHPDLTKKEIMAIVRTILIKRSNKVSRAYILDFKVPGLGRFRTHANKVVKRKNKTMSADRKRKRELQKKIELTKERLLW
jgi:hypothetical protein